MEKEMPKLTLTLGELHTILIWYETLQQEGGNEEEDDVLYAKLESHYDSV